MRFPPQTTKTIPLLIAGSNKYGRYPMISIEQTFNMIISDGWLVPLAGYKLITPISSTGFGRGIYASALLKKIIAVINDGVYFVNPSNAYERIGTIATFDGDVFLTENNAGQIAICDKKNIYIYDQNLSPSFQTASINFLPGYIAFQNGVFISVDLRTAAWRLSDFNNGLNWPDDANHTGEFQTKPNHPVAAVPFPGKGNLLMLFGDIVAEFWEFTGQQLFPYQKLTYIDSDYGCLNAATIAASDKYVFWLGANEKSGPVILVSDGIAPQKISTDGIDFQLAHLKKPSDSYGFCFRQDGHLIYQLTFRSDGFSLLYDFETKSFFTPTDQSMGYHIAKRVVYFNDSYYFVAINDGNVYELSSKYTNYNGSEIPRVRVCPTLRLPNSARFIINNLTFYVEQGEYQGLEAIDFSFSKDNGNSFSSYSRIDLTTMGHRQRRINLWSKGYALNFTPQFRFYGTGRFLAQDGTMSYYQ